jgi:putative glutamine amidotransferase
LPNHPEASLGLLDRLRPVGAVLTGGGDLAAYGGDSPERDDTEARLLDLAFAGRLPVIGVCRGMQAIQHRCGVPLEPVDSHVATTHPLHGEARAVNSFHTWGARTSAPALIVRARAKDGVVEAVEHREAPVRGVMWHPERVEPFEAADIALFRAALGGAG